MSSSRPEASCASAVTVELGRPSPTVSRVTCGRWAAAFRGPEAATAAARNARCRPARCELRLVWPSDGVPGCLFGLESTNPQLLHEGDLVDLTQRRDAREHLLERRVAQERHAFLARGLLDLGRGAALEDQLADAVRHVEQLRDRGAAVEAGAA